MAQLFFRSFFMEVGILKLCKKNCILAFFFLMTLTSLSRDSTRRSQLQINKDSTYRVQRAKKTTTATSAEFEGREGIWERTPSERSNFLHRCKRALERRSQGAEETLRFQAITFGFSANFPANCAKLTSIFADCIKIGFFKPIFCKLK